MPTAYTFLTDSDVRSRVRDEHLNDLVDRDTLVVAPDPSDTEAYAAYIAALNASETVKVSCESMAIAKVRSVLSNRFDTTGLLSATGEDRHPLLVLHVLNVMVYLLYRRINPRKVPEVVKEDHDETLAWLDRVSDGREAPDFPPVEPPEDNAGLPRVGGAWIPKGHYF
jgi:hypothetical protein